MQRSTFFNLIRRIAGVVLLVCAPAQAAELGDIAVRSFIGQPLVADIELTAVGRDEAADLQVRLAAPDVYRVANISMNPALQSFSLSVVRRDQRQFLHITSLKRIDANYLNVFLELSGGGHSVVRAATLWLVADPAPPAPPIPMPAPVRAAIPAAPLPPPAPMPAPVAAPLPPAPVARLPEPVPSAALLAARARAAMTHAPVPESAPEPAPKPDPKPAPAVKRPEPRAVAAPMPAPRPAGRSKEDLALERKNAALTSKLVELEGKIKVLQDRLLPKTEAGKAAGAPAAAVPAASAAAAASAASEPAHAPVPLRPKLKALGPSASVKTPPETASRWPLLAGAGGVLLLAGGGLYLMLRRKKDKPPSEPSKYWVLLRKPFGRKKKPAEVPEPAVEPTLA